MYLAEDVNLGRMVAVKLLSADPRIAEVEDAKQRLSRLKKKG